MQTLPDKTVVLKSESGQLVLTSYRVRYHSESFDAANVVSIMLEQVVSCGLVHSTVPLLLILAGICGLLVGAGPDEVRVLLLIVGAVFVGAYFATRKHILAIASSGHHIKVEIQGMSTAGVMRFIEATELAKNKRLDRLRPLTGAPPTYVPPSDAHVTRNWGFGGDACAQGCYGGAKGTLVSPTPCQRCHNCAHNLHFAESRMKHLAILALVSTAACIPPTTQLKYDVGLTAVQRPVSAQQRYGEQIITPVKDSVGKYRFEDKLIAATFLVVPNQVLFELENRSEYPVQISWTEAAFVDPKGQSQPVMHTGVKYTDCTSPKAPSVLVAKGRLTDVIVPCNYVKMGYSSWVELDFLPNNSMVPLDSADAVAKRFEKDMKGKTIQVLLPIKTQDVVNDYTFTFQVNSVSPAGRAMDYTGKP